MAKTIYIAGLGLIGASMALGIMRDHPDYEILGYNRSQASRDIALERGMIDPASEIMTPSFSSKVANSCKKAMVCLIGKVRMMTSASGAKLAKSSVARSIIPRSKAISLDA